MMGAVKSFRSSKDLWSFDCHWCMLAVLDHHSRSNLKPYLSCELD